MGRDTLALVQPPLDHAINFRDPFGLCAGASDTIKVRVSVDCGEGRIEGRRDPTGLKDCTLYFWYTYDTRTGEILEILDSWVVCRDDKAGGSGGAGQGQAGVMAYTQVQQCPPINTDFLRQLRAEFRVGGNEGLERGGDYDVDAAARTVVLNMTGTNRTPASVRIPFRRGAAGYWHVHEDTPQTYNWPQGPSRADSALAVALQGPFWTLSRDSLFLITPRGASATAVGCAAPTP